MSEYKKLCVISTKNPTNLIVETVNNVKKYYSDFDIIIIDSDSDKFDFFNQIPSDVKIEYIKNQNWELGAWNYAFNKYKNYDLYMFIQDSLTPNKKLIVNWKDIIENDYVCSFHYDAAFGDGDHLASHEILKYVYKDTVLNFISKMTPDQRITGAAHSSWIANSKITKKILELEHIYIEKNIKKTKKDSWLSERSIGILISKYSKKRICINFNFTKKSCHRDY